MAKRISALHEHLTLGQHNVADEVGVSLSEIDNLVLHQVAAWPESLRSLGELIATASGLKSAAQPCFASGDSTVGMLRVEPLKWWLVGAEPPKIAAEQGAVLDISHSRTRIRVSGPQSVALLNRLLPLDLRDANFPLNSVASSAIHHVGVTLWRNDLGYELFIPRGFAVSIWEVLFKSALQFGVEVS